MHANISSMHVINIFTVYFLLQIKLKLRQIERDKEEKI